jgi:hypothetical protein
VRLVYCLAFARELFSVVLVERKENNLGLVWSKGLGLSCTEQMRKFLNLWFLKIVNLSKWTSKKLRRICRNIHGSNGPGFTAFHLMQCCFGNGENAKKMPVLCVGWLLMPL